MQRQEKEFKDKVKKDRIELGRFYMDYARESGIEVFLERVKQLQREVIHCGGGGRLAAFGTSEHEMSALAHEMKVAKYQLRLAQARKNSWAVNLAMDAADHGISLEEIGTTQKEVDTMSRNWFRARAKHALAKLRAGERKWQDLYWLFGDIEAAKVKPQDIGMTAEEVARWEPFRYKYDPKDTVPMGAA